MHLKQKMALFTMLPAITYATISTVIDKVQMTNDNNTVLQNDTTHIDNALKIASDSATTQFKTYQKLHQ